MNARTYFKTDKAERYLGTLCKHFGHKVPTEVKNRSGWVEFSFARCDMEADDAGLSLTVKADVQSDLDKAKQVVGSHLERFAFRENPELSWHSDVGTLEERQS